MSTITLPSKIVVTGDTHGSLGSLEHVFIAARRADLDTVLVVGDFWTYAPRELVKLRRMSDRHGVKRIAFLRGNHEDYSVLAPFVDTAGPHWLSDELVFLADGTRIDFDGGATAVVCGGAASGDRLVTGIGPDGRKIKPRVEGKDWWPREVVTDADVAAVVAAGRADIAFTHDVPSHGLRAYGMGPRVTDGVLAMEEYESRRRLTAAVEAISPALLIHGHMHTRRSAEGYDGVQYEGLDCNARKGSTVALDTVTRELTPLI